MKKIVVLLAVLTERDNNAVFPVLHYLKNKYGYDITIKNVLDYKSIIEEKYDAALFANIVGEKIGVRAAKFCNKINLPVISLSMEGNIVEKRVGLFTWGYIPNHEKIIDLRFMWSNKYKKIVLKHFPELKGSIEVSGSTGFDRYQMFEPENKDLLKKYEKNNFKKVITYATWGFDLYIHEVGFDDLEIAMTRKEISKMIQDRINIKNILENIIKKNPKTLFILKIHPMTIDFNSIEIDIKWDKKYENVLIIKNEEKIQGLLNVSDIWIGYESTTFLEAWCMDKPTIKIIPTPDQKWRTNLYEGSAVANNFKELQNKINEYYTKGKIKEFENKKEKRKEIIKDSINSKDGLNSYRTAKKINEFLENKETEIKIKFKHKIEAYFWDIFFRTIYLMKFLRPLKKYKQLEKILSINRKGPLLLKKYSEKMDATKKRNLSS